MPDKWRSVRIDEIQPIAVVSNTEWTEMAQNDEDFASLRERTDWPVSSA